MERSTDRILTTHAGRLDGPPDLMQMTRDIMAGRPVDLDALEPRVRSGIVEVIRKQAQAGIDVISDGELGKFGFGSPAYYTRRLSGLATRRLKPGEAPYMALQTNESSSPNSIETFDFYRLHRSERSDLPFVRL